MRAAKIAYLAHNWKLKNKDPTKKPQTNVDNTMAVSSSTSTSEKPQPHLTDNDEGMDDNSSKEIVSDSSEDDIMSTDTVDTDDEEESCEEDN